MKGKEIKKLLGRTLAIILSVSMVIGSNGIATLAADGITDDTGIVSEEQSELDFDDDEGTEESEESEESERLEESEENPDLVEDEENSQEETSEIVETSDETEREAEGDSENEAWESSEEANEDSALEEETVSDNEAEDSVTEESLNSDFEIDGNTLEKYTGTDEKVVIPDEIEVIGAGAFADNTYLKEIVISSSVTEIGGSAFSDCSNLATVDIRSSQIADSEKSYIFYGCAIKTVKFPDDMERIPAGMFYNAGFDGEGVKLEIPSTVKTIGDHAFYSAKNVEVVIPSDSELTEIGEEAFVSNHALKSIVIPETVTIIGNSAFNDCSSLATVDIKSSQIADSEKSCMFYGCAIKTVKFPNDMERIPAGMFYNAGFDGEGVKLEIPSTVKIIGNGAFLNARNVEVVIPSDSVLEEIGDSAFAGNLALKSIVIPEKVTKIGGGAFYGCTSLATVDIRSIQIADDNHSNVFVRCAIKTVIFPENIERIPVKLFQGAWFDGEGVKLEIPSTVKIIGKGAFLNAENVEVVIPSDSVLEEIGEDAFYNNIELKSILIPETVTKIGGNAFEGCSNLATVDIRSSQIADNADNEYLSRFAGCAIKTVNFPENIQRIPAGLFYNADFDKDGATIEIPSSVKIIGNSAFQNAANVDVIIPSGSVLEEIGENAFYNNKALKSILIPETVTKIGKYAFYDCSSLATVDIRSIQIADTSYSYLFKGCSIKNVYFPENMQEIPAGLFYFAGFDKDGATIEIPSTVKIIGDRAFHCAQNIAVLVIPASVTKIEFWALEGLEYTTFKVVKGSYAATYLANNGYKNQCSFALNITYKLKGGVNSPDNPATFDNDNIIYFADPSRTGYTFEGWFTDEACTKKIESTAGKNNSITIYAKWKAITYGVVYDSNFPDGASVKLDIEIPVNTRRYDETFVITNKKPAAYKYVFIGWNTEADGSGTSYAPGASASKLTSEVGANVTLYGQWNYGKYNIVFDANPKNAYSGAVATGTMKSVKAQFGNTSNVIPKNAFSIENVVFDSWNTRADGMGMRIGTNEIGTYLDSLASDCGANVTLYAMWVSDSYTLNVYASDELYVPMAFVYGEVIRSKINMVIGDIRPGYKLNSLNTKADGTGTKILLSAMNVAKPGKTKTLYAQWAPIKYTITYKLDGVQNNANNRTSYTVETPDFKLLKPMAKPGYTFDGWYNGGVKVTEITKGTSGDLELEARWVLNTYTVVVHADTTSKANKKYFSGTIDDYEFTVSYGETIDMLGLTREYTQYCVENGGSFKDDLHYIVGYAVKANGDIKYGYAKNFKNLATTAGAKVHLYAVIGTNNNRKKITYMINDDVVNNVSNPVTYKCGEKTVIYPPKRKGYTFAGWSAYWDNGTLSECEMFDAGKNVIKAGAYDDIVLEANWTPVKYKVRIFTNNDAVKFSGEDSNINPLVIKDVYYESECMVELDDMFEYDTETYVFGGLFRQPKGGAALPIDEEGVVDISLFKVANGAVVELYAHWSLRKYNIEYINIDPDSDFENMDYYELYDVKNNNPVTYTASKKVDLVNPTKYGFKFEGWYSDPEFTQPVTKITKTQRGDVVLYGKWSVK